MRFKYINLTKSREKQTKNNPNTTFYPGRRRFVKTMGLSILALNPVKNAIGSVLRESIIFNVKQNRLKVWLNNQLAWEISERYFEPGYSVHLNEVQGIFIINAKNLQFRKTQLRFSLNARIDNRNKFWETKFSIPEFNFCWEGNFKHWLEGFIPAHANGNLNQNILSFGSNEYIKVNGEYSIRLTPNWKVDFFSEQTTTFAYCNFQYSASEISVQPNIKTLPDFLNNRTGKYTSIQLQHFSDWKRFIENQNLNYGKLISEEGENGKLQILLPYPGNNKIIWAGNPNVPFLYKTEKVTDQPIRLENFFYYAEYLNDKPSQNYIAANLPVAGYWISNQLGAFKLEKDNKIPDFEAFGSGNVFNEVVLETRLRAFKPIVGNAVTLNSVYQDPPRVRIVQPQRNDTRTTTPPATNQTDQREEINRQTNENAVKEKPQQPERNITIPIEIQQNQQQPVRQVQQNQPQLRVEFDKLKFKPKNALSVIVLRPEDLVMLEFVFHNFNFTNKGQAPFLELDKPKENGIVEIYFQSQHTLEEAYFESTPIPDPDPLKPSNSGVRLPAKHLRARKSRLVYEFPAGHEGFPLILEELLDWTKFSLRVHPRAWIKLPSIKPIRIPTRISRDSKTTIQPNKNLRYLDTPSTEYGIKLAQHTKIKSANLDVYQESEVAKVLTPVSATSVRATFNINTIRNLSLTVGPIPELSTSIEAPTLLYISPNQTNDFYHKTTATFRDVEELRITTQQVLSPQFRVYDPLTTTKGEITELWHTRLGVKLKNGKTSGSVLPHLKTIRALWADDADKDYKVAKERNYPFMASLDANNRQKLVHTTSNYSLGFEPFPVPVNDLMLTTLGAYLDWHAFFEVPNPQDTYLNIIEWEHIATLGRDHFVKIVEEGYLFPFGHRAAIVKITERKFDSQTKAAANRQRMFVVVLEREVLYSRNDPEGKFIEFPFQAVRIETNATPNIDNPEDSTLITVPSSSGNLSRITRVLSSGSGANTTYNFYINVGKQGFPFDIVATDKEGREHPFRMPLAFMENRIARDKSLMEKVIEVYRGKQPDNFNKIYNEAAFNGQEIAYAEYLVDGDTDFETEIIKFDAQIYPVNGEGELKFHPKIKEAKVFVKQISELTGIREPATISLEDDNNKGGVFAKVNSKNVVDFSGGSDKAGGFLLPNMSVSGLSKLQGPVSGKLDDMKDLLFIPDDFFKAFEDLPVAKIFGVIEIFSLLFGTESSPFDLGGSFDDMIDAVSKIREEIENLKNEILYLENLAKETNQAVETQINELKQMIKNKVNELLTALNDSIPRIPNLKTYLTEDAFYAEYKWQPELGGKTIEVFPGLLNVNVNNPSNALSITTKFEKPFDATKPAAMNGVARFEKFGVDIVPLLAVNFNYLEFRTGSSQKTDVKVDIDAGNPIEFKGVLNFVNNLQSIIPVGGFSDDGPYIDLKPTGVTAGFNISIPNVEVGICMISNISLGASVTLPFTGAPLTMGFNFCRRENPFMLTISCFGGGGYFMMATTLKGIQSIEAAFEFGAAMSLNVGVASGGVSAMGGFYYKMEIVEGVEQTTLTGYLRLNGHLSILGLITLSLEFYLAFNAVIYQGKVQKLEGVATLKVKIEIAFFSKTVKVSVRRELKGADADPKFIEMIELDDWQQYCLAFAG